METAPNLRMELPAGVTELIASAEELILALVAKPILVHDDYEAASTDRNLVNDLIKELENKRKELTAPIDALKKQVMARFSGPTDKLGALKAALENEMMLFKRRLDEERERQQRELEAQARAEAAAEKQRLLELAKQELEKDETNKAEAILDIAEKVKASIPVLAPVKIPSSEVATKKLWKFRVVDLQKIPRDYLIPNEKLLQAIATGSKEQANIPGVEFFYEETISAKRK